MRKNKCGFFVVAGCSSAQGHFSGDMSLRGTPEEFEENGICARGDCSRHVPMRKTHRVPGSQSLELRKLNFMRNREMGYLTWQSGSTIISISIMCIYFLSALTHIKASAKEKWRVGNNLFSYKPLNLNILPIVSYHRHNFQHPKWAT